MIMMTMVTIIMTMVTMIMIMMTMIMMTPHGGRAAEAAIEGFTKFGVKG